MALPSPRSRAASSPEESSPLPAGTLLPATSDEAFERFVRLVRHQLSVPVALVTLVSAEEQVFPGAAGLPEPYQSERRTPLSHSFCQHVVASSEPLVVEDARRHPWSGTTSPSPTCTSSPTRGCRWWTPTAG